MITKFCFDMKSLYKLSASMLVLGALSLQPAWGMKEDDATATIILKNGYKLNYFENKGRSLFVKIEEKEYKIPPLVVEKILLYKQQKDRPEELFLHFLLSIPKEKIPYNKLFRKILESPTAFKGILNDENPIRNELKRLASVSNRYNSRLEEEHHSFCPREFQVSVEEFLDNRAKGLFYFAGSLLGKTNSQEMLEVAKEFFQILPPSFTKIECTKTREKKDPFQEEIQAEFAYSALSNMNSFVEVNLNFSHYGQELTEKFLDSTNIWTSPLRTLRLKLGKKLIFCKPLITEKLNQTFKKIKTSNLKTLCLRGFSFDDKNFTNIASVMQNNNLISLKNCTFTTEASTLFFKNTLHNPTIFVPNCYFEDKDENEDFTRYMVRKTFSIQEFWDDSVLFTLWSNGWTELPFLGMKIEDFPEETLKQEIIEELIKSSEENSN